MYDSGYDGDDEDEWATGPFVQPRDDDGEWWRPGRQFISEPLARRFLVAREEEAMQEEVRRRREEEEMATESQEAADGDGEEPDEFLWCCPGCWAKSWASVEEMLEAHGFVDDAVYAPFDNSMW